MSLYNALFGVNRLGPLIIHLIGADPKRVPRLRDAYITDDGKFAIFARVGGGNREGYAEGIAYLQGLPGYLRDADDGFDDTYATFYYDPPANIADLVPEALQVQGHYDPMERFKKTLDDMKAGVSTPDTDRAWAAAQEMLKPVANALKAMEDGDKPNEGE